MAFFWFYFFGFFCKMNIKRSYTVSATLAISSCLVVLFAPIFLLPDFVELMLNLLVGSIILLTVSMALAIYTIFRETQQISLDNKTNGGYLEDYAEMYRERRSK